MTDDNLNTAVQPLTWSLVIATYKREHILPRCLRLAAKQTRPPREVIVVDASPDWETTRSLVTQEFAVQFPQIPLIYVKANFPSLTAQRNQGIDLARGDVLFLIDDDSLMYPDCAEAIMQVYDADIAQTVQGVSAIPTPVPPDATELASGQITQSGTVAAKPQQTRLRQVVKSLLATDQTYFLPYDETYPDRPISENLDQLNIARIQVMAGYTMTFRRAVLKQERFSEVLQRYAAGEDQDLSYRVSRHGAIVNALNARLCHLEISGGRLSRFQVTVLAALNPSVLQQFYSPDRKLVNRRWRNTLWRRVLISFLKDLSEREFRFTRTRGVLYALAQLGQIWAKSPDELMVWYPEFQSKLLATQS
jgi:glycosyltransferase involved in cell wall biosynthesis